MRLIANSAAGVLIRDYSDHHVTVLVPPALQETRLTETVLLLGNAITPLGTLEPHALTESHVAPIWAAKPEVVIVGVTELDLRLLPAQRAWFLQQRIGLEVMMLGAACRTYSVLASDGRSAAALLFPRPLAQS